MTDHIDESDATDDQAELEEQERVEKLDFAEYEGRGFADQIFPQVIEQIGTDADDQTFEDTAFELRSDDGALWSWSEEPSKSLAEEMYSAWDEGFWSQIRRLWARAG